MQKIKITISIPDSLAGTGESQETGHPPQMVNGARPSVALDWPKQRNCTAVAEEKEETPGEDKAVRGKRRLF